MSPTASAWVVLQRREHLKIRRFRFVIDIERKGAFSRAHPRVQVRLQCEIFHDKSARAERNWVDCVLRTKPHVSNAVQPVLFKHASRMSPYTCACRSKRASLQG